MKKLIILCLLICPFSNLYGADKFACKPPSKSKWFWSDAKLVKNTEEVFIGELLAEEPDASNSDIVPDFERGGIGLQPRNPDDKFGYTKWKFKVLKNLKGNFKENEEITFSSLSIDDKPARSLLPISCDIILKFKKGHKYMIFFKSYHPNGYKEVIGSSTVWLKTVQKFIDKEKAN